MTIHKYVLAVGLLAAVVGFIFLFVPVSETASNGVTMNCGSIGSPNKFAGTSADLYDIYTGGAGQTGGRASCEDARDSQKMWVFPMLFGGLVVAIGAGLTLPRKRDTPETVPSDETTPA